MLDRVGGSEVCFISLGWLVGIYVLYIQYSCLAVLNLAWLPAAWWGVGGGGRGGAMMTLHCCTVVLYMD